MIFVTVGTHEQPFDRLIRAIDEWKRDGVLEDEVIMQTGYCDYQPQFCTWKQFLDREEMSRLMKSADHIVTHGGISTIVEAWECGKTPIVMPRRKEYGEHVNDHQVEFVRKMIESGRPIALADNEDTLRELLTSDSQTPATGKDSLIPGERSGFLFRTKSAVERLLHCSDRGSGPLFCAVAGLMWIGALASWAALPVMLVMALLMLFVSVGSFCRGTFRRYHSGYLIALLAVQNLMIGLGSAVSGNTDPALRLLTQVPTLALGICFLPVLVDAIRNREWNVSRVLFVLYLAVIALSLLQGHGVVSAMLMSVRNMTVFYLAYEVGRADISSESRMIAVQRVILLLACVLIVVGIPLLIGGYPAYERLGIQGVYVAKGMDGVGAVLDDRFTTSLISRSFVRMGSFLFDPVNLGYFMALAVLVAMFGSWTKRKGLRIILAAATGIGLLLTIGKGGYLLLAAAVGCIIAEMTLVWLVSKLIHRTCSPAQRRLIGIAVKAAVVCGIIVFSVYYYHHIGAAASPHFWSIEQTWLAVKDAPLGHGIGTGGNVAHIFGDGQITGFQAGEESAFMSLLYQLGVMGGVLFAALMLSISPDPSRYSDGRNKDMFLRVCSYLPLLLLLMSVYQENTVTPVCIVPYMLLIGGASAVAEKGLP